MKGIFSLSDRYTIPRRFYVENQFEIYSKIVTDEDKTPGLLFEVASLNIERVYISVTWQTGQVDKSYVDKDGDAFCPQPADGCMVGSFTLKVPPNNQT